MTVETTRIQVHAAKVRIPAEPADPWSATVRQAVARAWRAKAKLAILAVGLTTRCDRWVLRASSDLARVRELVADEARVVLRDDTIARLDAPWFDENSVYGVRVSFCEGASCDRIHQTLSVRRGEVTRMSLRDPSEDGATAAARRAHHAEAVASAESARENEALLHRRNARYARHALYLGGTTLGLSNGVGLTYNYQPLRSFAVSLGVGTSVFSSLCIFSCPSPITSAGAQAMAHFFSGWQSSNFEFALGVALVETSGAFLYDDGSRGLRVYPSTFLGYRFQPLQGGFLFRVGAAWEYGLALGLHLGLGAAF